MLTRDQALAARQHDVVGERFTLKKVADHFACSPEGAFILVESKATRANVFQFARIKEHQGKSLTTVSNTKYGKAYLALNFRDVKGPGRAWLIPWGWLEIFISQWSKKSIRKAEAEEEFWKFELERITGGWEKQGPRLI